MALQQQLRAEPAATLTDYVQAYAPPGEVVVQAVIVACLAFSLIQFEKNRRRARRLPRMDTYDKQLTAFLAGAVLMFANLWGVQEMPVRPALVWALQTAIATPLLITALLWVLGIAAPQLRLRLRTYRRESSGEPPPGHPERRHRPECDNDDSTRYL